MSTQLREVTIGNNLTIRFIDRSRHYYGGFFQAAVEAVCDIPVTPEYIQAPAEHEQAISLLGQTAHFSKVLDRMGVLATDLEKTREQLIDEFLETAAPYLAMEDFPSRFILSEINKQLRRKVRTPGITGKHA